MPDITSLQIKVDSTQVKQGTTDLNNLGRAGTTAETGVKKVESASDALSKSLNKAKISVLAITAGVTALSAAMFAMSIKSLKVFAEYEKGMIGVSKTTNFTSSEVKKFSENINTMARSLPIATSSLLSIAEAAGQMGITGVTNVTRFTETMGKLQLATDVVGAEGAAAIARLLTVTGEGVEKVDKFGAVLVALGNSSAATESEILSLGTQIGQATSTFGVTSSQAIALGAAMKSIGVQAELGGSVVGRAMRAIEESINAGGDSIKDLSALTGIAAKDLKVAFGEDATAVFQKWLDGVGGMIRSGNTATEVLDRFGLKGEEILKVIPTMAINNGVLAKSLDTANEALRDGSALNVEAAKAAEGLDSQLQLVNNIVHEVYVSIGEHLAPTLKDTINEFKDWWEVNDDLVKQDVTSFFNAMLVVMKDLASWAHVTVRWFSDMSSAMDEVGKKNTIRALQDELYGLESQLNRAKNGFLGFGKGSEEEIARLEERVKNQAELIKEVEDGSLKSRSLAAKKKKAEDEANLVDEIKRNLDASKKVTDSWLVSVQLRQKAEDDLQASRIILSKAQSDTEKKAAKEAADAAKQAAKEYASFYESTLDRLLPLVKEQREYNAALKVLNQMDPTKSTEAYNTALKNLEDSLTKNIEKAKELHAEVERLAKNIQLGTTGPDELRNAASTDQVKQQNELLRLQNEYNEAVDKQVAIQAELGKAYGLSAAEAEKLKAAFASEQIKKEVDALSYLSTFSGQDFGNEIAEGINRAALSVSKMNEMFEKQMDLQDKISKKREKISKDTSMDAKDRKKALEELDNLESSMISDQLSGYSNLFGTLGQLFDENSQARKNMHTLEMAFAAAEIAMNLQKALTNAVVAITNQGEGDPYTAFARIAAMVALMGGIVGMVGGSLSGGSGSAVSQTPTATTGTVFGDSTAQSASLQNSTDILETYAEKQYSELRGIYSEMVSLNANITGLVSGLIRSVGGQFEGGIISDVASQSMKMVSSFIDPLSTWLFGGGKLARWMWGGTEKSVTGAGINVSPTKIGDILSGGSANVQQYQDIQTKKTGLFGGLFGGNSTSNSTEYKAMSEDVNRLFTQVFKDMSDSIIDLTKGLGGDISTALSYAFSIPKLDLMGKTGSEITEAVQAAISTAFDNAADAILGDIVGKYQQVSEGMFETAVRVYSEQVIVLDALGKTGNSASGDLLELTQSIIDLAGGSQEFLKSFENYIELFTSDNEKVAASLKFLNESFSGLGFTLPLTRDGFKELISSLDVTTAAGQKAYVSLIGLADSADQVYSAVEDVMTDINERLKLEGMTDLEKEVYNINKTFNEYTNTLIAAGHAGEDLILVEKQRANEINKVMKAEEEARQKSISQISASISDVLRVDSISDFENAIYLVNEKYKEMTANLKDLEAGSMDLIRVEQARVVEINNLVEANKKSISDATSGISVSVFTSAMSDMEKSIYDIGVSFDATREKLKELGAGADSFVLVDEGQKLAMQKLSDDFFSTFNDAFAEIGMTDFEKSLRQLRAEYELNIATAKTLTDDEELLNMVRAVSDDKIKALYAEQLKSNLDKAISDLEDSIDETTNALQKALDDANESLSIATDNLKRAFEKENESITSAFDLIVEGMQAGIDSAKEKASEAKSAFDAIDSALKSLLGNDLLKTYSFQAAQDDLLRRSKTKDFSGDLSGTLSSATNFDTKNFASATDYTRSFLKTSIMLAEMKGTAETQLSAADLTVKRLEEGLEAAKKQNAALLQSNNDRLNALLGLDETTMTVEEAIINFQKQQKEALRANDLLERQTEWMSAQYNALLGINSSVLNLRAAILAVISAQKATTGFATGGSFAVSGSGGIDNLSLPNLRVSAGEMVNVSRGDVMGALHKEISELRKEVAGLRRESIKHNSNIEKNTAVTAKQLKRWDGDGMPDVRVF